MGPGDLVQVMAGGPVYTQPVGINDQQSAIRCHAGFVAEGTQVMVIETHHTIGLPKWAKVLAGGKVVWLNACFLQDLEAAGPVYLTSPMVY